MGIIGDKAAQNHGAGLTNADIGVVQMFGSITHNIPPRDFLLMPIQRNQKNIIRGMENSSVKEAIERKDYKAVFKLLGALAEGYVQKAFESSGYGQWAPNSPTTVARKGSSKPLIDTGQLRRSITSDVVKKGKV